MRTQWPKAQTRVQPKLCVSPVVNIPTRVMGTGFDLGLPFQFKAYESYDHHLRCYKRSQNPSSVAAYELSRRIEHSTNQAGGMASRRMIAENLVIRCTGSFTLGPGSGVHNDEADSRETILLVDGPAVPGGCAGLCSNAHNIQCGNNCSISLLARQHLAHAGLNSVTMASAHSSQNQPPAAPFAISMRRRTILACSNCRRRKIRCITTEQPPKNPCARCVKKGLACEYVAAPEAEEQATSTSRPQTPDTSGAPREYARASSGHSNTPMNPAAFSGGRGHGAAPPLPYTGPPPVTRTPTGWGYVPPSLRGPNYPGAANSRASTSGTGSHQPYAHPRYYPGAQAPSQYAPGYPNPGYDPQYQYNMAAPGYGSQPPHIPPQAGAESFDYREFLTDYEGPGPSSSNALPPSSTLAFQVQLGCHSEATAAGAGRSGNPSTWQSIIGYMVPAKEPKMATQVDTQLSTSLPLNNLRRRSIEGTQHPDLR
ncbi:hypothetical protein FB451DRAFT_1172598 [Mycena latifolia]|nr:hypothetical protein FB451DRAFT_1172598 [Mycena latifolia]